jgi:hypothetical protein
MKTSAYLGALKEKLLQIEEHRDALLKLIAIEEGYAPESSSDGSSQVLLVATSSISGRIVNAIVELIHQKGRQVRTDEILSWIDEKQLSLGQTKNREASLAAILSQEIVKKTARLRRVERGVYDLKQ